MSTNQSLPDDIFGCGALLYINESPEHQKAIISFEQAKVPFTVFKVKIIQEPRAQFGKQLFEGLDQIQTLVNLIKASMDKQKEIEANKKLPENTCRVADKAKAEPMIRRYDPNSKPNLKPNPDPSKRKWF